MTPRRGIGHDIRHVVIVGGGTAGWLAALILGDAMQGRVPPRITVIDSSKIPTIGVGEGTTAVFRQMLKHFNMDEEAFIRETGATIKYGIVHRDWRRLGHTYSGPIDDPQAISGPGLDLYAVAAGKPVSKAHLFQHLMDRSRAPWALVGGRRIAAGPFHHAFHFDQARAGAFLRSRVRGATLIDDQVSGIERDPETGDIASLVLESGRRVKADLFVDCTGFRRVLAGPMGAEWVDYADTLPVNRAMPFWVELAEGEEIQPATLAWAQRHGWMWRIPTDERYGCGYVYSDKHISPDEAKAEIEAALGHRIEPRADIPITAGRLRDAWIGNCVAVGLSSSFLEPLEATSIHGTVVQLLWLARWKDEPKGRASYNAAVARQVDDFRDFIRLHYVSERRDSAFWRDVAESHPAALTERLAAWRHRLPARSDFGELPGNLPHVQEQLHIPVLDGLGLLDRGAAKAVLASYPKRRAQLRKAHEHLIREYAQAAGRCQPHRAYLRSLHEGKAA